MNKKFKLVNFKSPMDLTLTKARKIMGNSINKLEVGMMSEFRGYGNGINFTIQRMR
jgi:hypothetical protein